MKTTRRFKVIGIAKKQAQASLKDKSRESVTLIPLISAAGHYYPPTIIFKGKQIRGKDNPPSPLGAKWVVQCIVQCIYAKAYVFRLWCSERGYMNGVVGLEWILQDFDPATQELAGNHHWLLLVDGHSSHFTYDFLKYAKEHKIKVLCLHSNTTHILQSVYIFYLC